MKDTLIGADWADRRKAERRVDIDLNYSGEDRRLKVRDTDGTLVIRTLPDADRFNPDRIISAMMPFAA